MGTMVTFLDAVGFLIFAAILGSFTFWLVGYILWEALKFGLQGPSEQLRSVGTSILAEPPLDASLARPPVALERGAPPVPTTEPIAKPPEAA